MESHIATEEEYGKVEQAYWDLSNPDLLCAPNFTAPSMSEIISGKFTAIVCEDRGKVVGVMCVKNEDHGVFYPSMRGNHVAILRSMCALAQETFDSLTAKTENEYIIKLAQAGGLPFDLIDGVIVWSK